MGRLYNAALEFATKAHAGQTRNYTGESYVEHTIRVAKTIAEAGYGEAEQAAALLHDVLEDCPAVTFDELRDRFGAIIPHWVKMLTDVGHEFGNRAVRKKLDADRLASGDDVVHSIKCADTIDNTPSMMKYAKPDFAALYLKEKRALVPRLVRAHPVLLLKAKQLVGV